MTHIEIYKKYRPIKWAGLIGQEKTAKSLQNAVKAEKLPTAYLFAGPRGCGKTSAALLLAKAVNCENPSPKVDPCNECDTCKSIDEGRQMGVSYISAANIGAGGAEKIREIVQQSRLHQPVKKQVWIIDEIHNLSKQAFDALLIPLEEKNMPALFIFCTTEIDRVPQTIMSRIQARRFTLVPADTMTDYVSKIAKAEELDLSEEAITDAVRRGRGSVRDTLTSLESIADTGEFALSTGGQLLEAVSSQNLTEVLKVIAEAVAEGNDPRDLAEGLFEDLRNLLLEISGVDSSLVGIVPVTNTKAVAKGFVSKNGIMRSMDEIGDAITNMTLGADARILLEIGMVKIVAMLQKVKKAAADRAA